MKRGPKPGFKQSKAHVAKRAKAVLGEKNGRWKSGQRAYRRIAGAKPNDGTVVNHVDKDRTNNTKSNLQRLKDGTAKAGRKTTPKHEAITKRRSKTYKRAKYPN